MKRVITKQEEFEILKLVLDKFLLLGVIIIAFGFWWIIAAPETLWYGFTILAVGALLLLLFVWILMKEYTYVKR